MQLTSTTDSKHLQIRRRSLSIALVALVFGASQTWAAEFTATSSGFFSAINRGPSGTELFFSLSGSSTAGGAFVCAGTTELVYLTETTGACAEGELEGQIRPDLETVRSHCQFEGLEDIYNFTMTGTGCHPISCVDENRLPIPDCSFTIMGEGTLEGGDGMAEGSSGSLTYDGVFTYTQVEVLESRAVFAAGTIDVHNWQGDMELADGSVPPAGAALEIPSPGANVSGIGLISGWSCLGGELEVEFSDADGVIETMTVLQGSERLDTEVMCGDINNGFSATYNWSRLGSGEKMARLIRNGEEVDSQMFMVTAFDTEFVTGASGMCMIEDFPDMGKNATFVWEQSQQGLVLESVN